MKNISPQQPRKRVTLVEFVLGDVFLGFLAIVAAALTLAPFVFKLSPITDTFFEISQWSIVALFVMEYGVGFRAAGSKKSFILNPWRLTDAATIVIPTLTLLPGVSDLLRSSTVLRLVRLVRVLSLGVRASGVMVREEKSLVALQKPAPVQIQLLPGSGASRPREATWDEFVQWAKEPGSEWYEISNVGQHNVSALAKATRLSEEYLVVHLLGTNYPHLEVTGPFVSLFVWLPETSRTGGTERNGLLLLASDKSVVTLARCPVSLLDKIAARDQGELTPLPFSLRMLCQFLQLVLDANEHLVGHFEQQLRELEDIPVRESRPAFFERTFRLKKELSAAQSDLWRLRGVLKELAEAKVKFPGASSPGATHFLQDLAEAAEYLYDTVSNIKEGVLSLIDLHLNVVSFEMNRVMRVLAVVSVLGLIPAVIGGLFGMNLADNPWPFTLAQVTFLVSTAMVTCLYFFVVKGWLR
jgi:Mg2+ and Co2+ transporter CorA